MVSTTISTEAHKFTTPKRPLTWLITGCSSGFGLAIARKAQASGHRVIATSRNPSKTPEFVKEIESNGGKWVQLDLNDLENGKIIDNLEAEGDSIDVLVNNAGYGLLGVAEHLTEDEVRAQMETLYFGPYRLIRAVLPYMRQRRFGVITNISSGASLEARDSMAAYGSGKSALDALARVIAKEVAQFNIRVVTVVPGGFNTSMGVSGTTAGKAPIAADYHGSLAHQTIQYMESGKFEADGDVVKAAKAIYEVVVGEGVGAGRESEWMLPLGREIEPRIKLVRERLQQSLEAFANVANNVYVDK